MTTSLTLILGGKKKGAFYDYHCLSMSCQSFQKVQLQKNYFFFFGKSKSKRTNGFISSYVRTVVRTILFIRLINTYIHFSPSFKYVRFSCNACFVITIPVRLRVKQSYSKTNLKGLEATYYLKVNKNTLNGFITIYIIQL